MELDLVGNVGAPTVGGDDGGVKGGWRGRPVGNKLNCADLKHKGCPVCLFWIAGCDYLLLTIHHLPVVTLEDIHYHLYVLGKIKRGDEEIASGRRFTHEAARERLGRWLKT